MKHSELIAETRNKIGEDLFSKAKAVRKGSSSGVNYINVVFETESERNEAAKSFSAGSNHMFCMKRYGFGIIVNQYNINK